jgi:hypothetical protein
MSADFELWQDGQRVASVSGPRESALRDIQHYAMVYSPDGAMKVYEIVNGKRKEIAL